MYQKRHSLSFSNLFPMPNQSTDFGIPFNFPDRMLSNYSQFKSKAGQEEQQDDQNKHENEGVNRIENEDAQQLVETLGLPKLNLVPEKSQKESQSPPVPASPLKSKIPKLQLRAQHKQKVYEDTKNLLRNFGNAQNQFILYNQRAAKIVKQSTNQPQKFYTWVRKLKLQNFQQFKKVWTGNAGNSKLYTRLYKQLCWKFYQQEAVPYVMMSRMKNQSTKMTHLKYIFRFLEGIRDPENFKYFKKQ